MTTTDLIGKTDIRIAEMFQDGTVIIRRARKQWRCDGGHDSTKRTRCTAPIAIGSDYVEYLGETPLYQSGYRYHFACAIQQGLVERI